MAGSLDVILALGTNLGDRLANLAAAQAMLAEHMTLIARSPVYETPPWGFTDQPAFLNMTLIGRTLRAPGAQSALDLLAALKNIEQELGRQPTFRNGPRLIDLDILFYASLVLDLPGLTIPHPRLAERQFVLVPLADIAPGFVHPVSGLTVRQMLERLDEPVTARRVHDFMQEK
jgi:2-amino-4-hydroxy-6-hydroxymethyldihydropteridine diphosphokinase